MSEEEAAPPNDAPESEHEHEHGHEHAHAHEHAREHAHESEPGHEHAAGGGDKTGRPTDAVGTAMLVAAGAIAVAGSVCVALGAPPLVTGIAVGVPSLVLALLVVWRLGFGADMVAVFAGAFALYGVYFDYTTIGQRNHDGPSHLKYVQYVVQHWSLPDKTHCFVCHHPPAYYDLAALVYKGAELTRLGPPVRAVQALSLLLCFVFLLFTALTVRRFTRRRATVTFATALCAFWPYTIMNSVRLHNDVMFATTAAVALYLTVRWYQDGKQRDLWLAAAACLLAVMSKTSGLVMVATLGVSVLYRFATSPGRWGTLKRVAPAMLALCAAVGAFTVLRGAKADNDLRHRAFGTAYEIHPRDYVGNEPFNYLYFDLETFLREPYIMARLDGSGRQYFWNHLLKSSLFATHNTIPDVETSYRFNRRIAVVMNWMLLAMIALTAASLFGARRGTPGRAKYLPVIAFAVFMLAAHVVFKATIPHSHHNDFRMSYPVLVAGCLAFALALEGFGERRLVVARLGKALGWSFVALAAFYYTPKYDLVVRYLPRKVLRHSESDLRQPKVEGTDWDRKGNTILAGDELLEVEVAPIRVVTSVELTADHNDRYEVQIFGQHEIRRLSAGPRFAPPPKHGERATPTKGLARYQLAVDPPVKQARAVRIVPISGDRHYSVGHVVLNQTIRPEPR